MLDTEVDETVLFDQVRSLTVPHPWGGYCPPVIGYWDGSGYTHCRDCTPDPVVLRGQVTAIDADNSAAEGERCDFCGTGLLAAALEKFGKH